MAKKSNIGILTSSRADYGIYKCLLKQFYDNKNISISIIVFGMHLQKKHSYTINEIISDNYFDTLYKIKGMPLKDSKHDISNGYGNLIKNFSHFWKKYSFDLVFSLGDRFEMSAAVQSTIPFEIKIAHIHGGEISLGSVDNIYRDQISLSSIIHFTSNKYASRRLRNLLLNKKNIYNFGSLSLDNLNLKKIPSWKSVCDNYDIPIKPFVLITFHPETVGLNKNKHFVKILYKVLSKLSNEIHLVITQSNADTSGSYYREMNNNLKLNYPSQISVIENFGKWNYFSAIYNSVFLLGNTSSGIIEAASFGKFFLNVGDRQLGRKRSKNTIDVPFDEIKILKFSKQLIMKKKYNGLNIYHKKNTSKNILKVTLDYLKTFKQN